MRLTASTRAHRAELFVADCTLEVLRLLVLYQGGLVAEDAIAIEAP